MSIAQKLVSTKTPLGLGNLLAVLQNPLTFFEEIASDKELISFTIAGQRAYLLNHPDYVREMLVTKPKQFDKTKNVRWLKQLLGEGLLTSEGELHLHQRRLMQPLFHRKYIDNFAQTLKHYAPRTITEKWQADTAINIHQEWLLLTRKIISRIVLNIDLESKEAELHHALTGFIAWAERSKLPLAVAEFLDNMTFLPATARFRATVNYLNALLYPAIEQERAAIRSGKRAVTDANNLLTLLVAAQEEEIQLTGFNNRLTDKQVRDELLTLFLAGHNTVTQMLDWATYLLAAHPEIQTKMYAEIEQVLQGRVPEPEDLAKLTYTNAVLTEALRLYPPAYFILRGTREACQIGEHNIPANSFVIASPYLMQRNGRYYNEPSKFWPERWLTDIKKELPKFAYFPFGAGNRVCIGEPLARMEGLYLLTLLIQKWQVRLDPAHPVKPNGLLTIYPVGGIWVKLAPR